MFKEYAEAGLSKRSDKEVAISGLLRRIESTLGSCVHGIFSCFLSRLLLWRVSNTTRNATDDSGDIKLPSWSWMSHDHIQFFPEEHILVPEGTNSFNLELQLQVRIFELRNYPIVEECSERHLVWRNNTQEIGNFWLDTHEKTQIQYCVIVGKSQSEEIVFILLATEIGEKRYKRFGVGNIKAHYVTDLSIEGVLM
jgi:hypothetical protein